MKNIFLMCIVLFLFLQSVNATCGNHVCESSENFVSCPSDCQPSEVTIEVLEFDSEQIYMRGDEVFVKVKIEADGVPVSGANVAVVGFFGSMKLFDDGNHGDNLKLDTIFANSFIVPDDAVAGKKLLKITATKRKVTGETSVTMRVDTSLDILLQAKQTRFVLGDFVELDGYLKRRGVPFDGNVILTFSSGKETFKTVLLNADSNGFYSYLYHSSLIDPVGKWVISATALDEYGNTGQAKERFEMYRGIQDFYYTLAFVEPVSKIFNRGEIVKFLIELKDQEGKFMEDALVSLTLPDANPLELNEILPGIYSYSYKIPYDFSLGRQEIAAVASKDVNGFLFSGFSSKELIIDKANIGVERVRPKGNIFLYGDTIQLEFGLYYFDNTSVSNALVNLIVNNKPLPVEETEEGFYTATYVVSEEEDLEKISLSLSVLDYGGNEGSYADEFELQEGTGLPYFLRRNVLLLSGIAVVIVFIFAGFLLYVRRFSKLKRLLGRRAELKKLMDTLRQQHYEKGRMKTTQYKTLLNKYGEEMDEIDAIIAAGEVK